MSSTELPDTWRGAFRIELRAEAIGLASRGWPIMPGSYPGTPGWSGPEPVLDGWDSATVLDVRHVGQLWTRAPFSLLVATGAIVDAVEVDDALGRHAARLLREADQPAPIIAMPNGQWLFLTTAGRQLPPVLAQRPGIRQHAEGSWVTLPPTPLEHGVVHWRVKPDVWGRRLPQAGAVHGVLARAADELMQTSVGVAATAA